MTGAELIAKERQRQIEKEGWTSQHDDDHDSGQLAAAADCYRLSAYCESPATSRFERVWPWEPRWWKPSENPIRNLEKAGALYQAEIDRLTRHRDRVAVEIDRLLREEARKP